MDIGNPDQRVVKKQARFSNTGVGAPTLILNAVSLTHIAFVSRLTYNGLRNYRPSKYSRINPFRSHGVLEENLMPGDHIYTWTPAFIFSHHGIYCDKDTVIHLTAARKVISGSNPLGPTQCGINRCGTDVQGNGVFKSCLNCFKGGRSLYRYEYGVGTFEFLSKLRGGTCTIAESDPPKEVISRAFKLLERRFESYNLIFNNCEGFALYCKTGLGIHFDNSKVGGVGGQINSWLFGSLLDVTLVGVSGQVNSWLFGSISVLISLRLVRFIPNPVVAAAVGYAVHLLTRHGYDLGVRIDAAKVDVDDLVE